MIRRIVLWTFLLVALGGVGLGQQAAPDSAPPSREQVLKLIACTGIRQNIDAALDDTLSRMKAAARAVFQKKNPDADAATLTKLDAIFDSMPAINFEEISESVVQAYQKNLSASDVQAGIDFYTSKAGKQLLEKMPMIQSEANESGGKQVEKKLAEYNEQLMHKLETFEAELDKQKAPAADQPKAADTPPQSTDSPSKAADDKATDDKSTNDKSK